MDFLSRTQPSHSPEARPPEAIGPQTSGLYPQHPAIKRDFYLDLLPEGGVRLRRAGEPWAEEFSQIADAIVYARTQPRGPGAWMHVSDEHGEDFMRVVV